MTRPLFDDLVSVSPPRLPVVVPQSRTPGRVRELFAPPPAVDVPPRPRLPAPAPTLANRRFLLNDPRVTPVLVPGRLALHVAACSKLNGHLLWLWQVEQYAKDPYAFQVLALVRAVPVSLFPGVVRWLPSNELAELPVHQPLATVDEQRQWHPAPEVEAALAATEEIRRDPDVRVNAVYWSLLEAAAANGRIHPADLTAGVVHETPSSGLLPAVVAVLRRYGATSEAVNTMLTEMGMQSDDVGALMAMP